MNNITAQSICNTLNRLFEKDPAIAHYLVCNRVPVGEDIVNDEYIYVDRNLVIPERYSLGILGLLNGILLENNHKDRIAAKFDKETQQFLGFCLVELS